MIACVILPDVVSRIEQADEQQATAIILVNRAGKIQGASKATVQAGVRSGMQLHKAQALCPDALVKQFDALPYQQLAEGIEELLRVFTTRIEPLPGFWEVGRKAKPGSAPLHPCAAIYYLDLGRLNRKDGLVLAEQLHEMLQTQFSVSASIGLAASKFPAFTAARFTPAGQNQVVLPGHEADFLAEYSVSILPLGKAMAERLRVFGLQTVGDFAALPLGSVLTQFGKSGRFLHKLAQGRDTRPVEALPPRLTYTVSRTLDGPVQDQHIIERLLQEMACEIGQHLQDKGLTTQALRLCVQQDDGKVHLGEQALRESSVNGKLLGRSLHRLLAQFRVSDGVILVDVTALNLTPVQYQQLDLFGTPTAGKNSIADLLDSLASRFGSESLCHVTVVEADHWLIERRFVIDRIDAA